MEEYMLPCLTKQFFGFSCPGCGGQRAFILLIKGNFTEAFFMYPAIYPLLIWGFMIVFNLFFPFKLYPKMVSFFAILSVGAILVNFIIHFPLFNLHF